jgi:hypothetical protein
LLTRLGGGTGVARYTVYKIAEPKKPNDPGKRRAAELFARAYQIDPGFTPDWGVAGRPQRSARKVHLGLGVSHGPERTRVDIKPGPSF